MEGIERSLASVRLELEDVEAAARAAEAKEEQEREDEQPVEEYDEDFHLWLSRAGGPSGGWTHDDHLVLTTLTHRLNLLILCCIHSPFAILQLDKVFTICVSGHFLFT